MANNKQETRSYTAEIRAASESEFALEGTAVKYGALADLGKFREVVAPGAFKRTLSNGSDVKCLLQHDGGRVLGRTSNKTLTLRDTSAGLQFRCQLDPANPEHRSAYAMCARGDMNECSFGFQTDMEDSDDWAEATDDRGQRYIKRTLRNVNLFEISVVSFPAYKQGTSAQARTEGELDWRTVTRAKLAELDAQMDEVNRRICARIAREIEGK
jgi:uncharacterized protein